MLIDQHTTHSSNHQPRHTPAQSPSQCAWVMCMSQPNCALFFCVDATSECVVEHVSKWTSTLCNIYATLHVGSVGGGSPADPQNHHKTPLRAFSYKSACPHGAPRSTRYKPPSHSSCLSYFSIALLSHFLRNPSHRRFVRARAPAHAPVCTTSPGARRVYLSEALQDPSKCYKSCHVAPSGLGGNQF